RQNLENARISCLCSNRRINVLCQTFDVTSDDFKSRIAPVFWAWHWLFPLEWQCDHANWWSNLNRQEVCPAKSTCCKHHISLRANNANTSVEAHAIVINRCVITIDCILVTFATITNCITALLRWWERIVSSVTMAVITGTTSWLTWAWTIWTWRQIAC